MPEAVGVGEGTARDDIMDMGVILQGTSPGMKDSRGIPEDHRRCTFHPEPVS